MDQSWSRPPGDATGNSHNHDHPLDRIRAFKRSSNAATAVDLSFVRRAAWSSSEVTMGKGALGAGLASGGDEMEILGGRLDFP